jgi:hypothetical protein
MHVFFGKHVMDQNFVCSLVDHSKDQYSCPMLNMWRLVDVKFYYIVLFLFDGFVWSIISVGGFLFSGMHVSVVCSLPPGRVAIICYAGGVDDVLLCLKVCASCASHFWWWRSRHVCMPFDTWDCSSTYSIQIVALFLILASSKLFYLW